MHSDISYSKVNECINEMQKINQNLNNIVDEFFVKVNRLQTGNYWIGPGASYYQNQANSLRPTMEDACNKMNEYITILTNVVSNYQNVDKEVLDYSSGE